MSQHKLFYDDEFEALNLMVSNSGKGFKPLAGFLFPHLKIDSAYARLKNCLNPDRDERLTLGQIVAAMLFCDSYEPLLFACDETSHTRPERKARGEAEMELVQAINSAADTMQRALQRIDHLKSKRAAP